MVCVLVCQPKSQGLKSSPRSEKIRRQSYAEVNKIDVANTMYSCISQGYVKELFLLIRVLLGLVDHAFVVKSFSVSSSSSSP